MSDLKDIIHVTDMEIHEGDLPPLEMDPKEAEKLGMSTNGGPIPEEMETEEIEIVQVSEDDVENLLTLFFDGTAAIRRKEYWSLDDKEISVMVPRLTIWINKRPRIAKLVSEANAESGIVLFLIAIGKRLLLEMQDKRDEREAAQHGGQQGIRVDPFQRGMGQG